VLEDGTFSNRKLFAYVDTGIPDGVLPKPPYPPVTGTARHMTDTRYTGIQCDSMGNVYTGCGDGVYVWNPRGKLIGKIYIGRAVPNFNFAGEGRMVILSDTRLYYATLAATGGQFEDETATSGSFPASGPIGALGYVVMSALVLYASMAI
jgi:gluconolactonase